MLAAAGGTHKVTTQKSAYKNAMRLKKIPALIRQYELPEDIFVRV